MPQVASAGKAGGKGHQQSPYNEVPREEEIEREMAELDSAWKS